LHTIKTSPFYALFLLIFLTPTAFAHKLNMFAYVEGDRILVEGYFSSGKKAMNSKISVYNPAREVIVEGVTNEQGEYTFVIPQQSDLRITLYAGMGHKTEYTVTADEISGISTAAPPSLSSSPKLQTNNKANVAMSSTRDDALRQLVQESVAKAAKPLAREISELKNKTSLSDIVGGIGFIIGLFGAFAYYKSRQTP